MACHLKPGSAPSTLMKILAVDNLELPMPFKQIQQFFSQLIKMCREVWSKAKFIILRQQVGKSGVIRAKGQVVPPFLCRKP